MDKYLRLRKDIVDAIHLLNSINEQLYKFYTEEAGWIDAGDGQKIPPLEVKKDPPQRQSSPCCE